MIDLVYRIACLRLTMYSLILTCKTQYLYAENRIGVRIVLRLNLTHFH